MATYAVPSVSRRLYPGQPARINWANPITRGLTRAMRARQTGEWVTNYARVHEPCTVTGTPTLKSMSRGRVGCYGTGGASVNIPATAYTQVTDDVTWRFVFQPISWPGAFTAWIDDVNRLMSTFINTSGAISFAGAYWNFGGNTLTTGVRWDLVISHKATVENRTYMQGVSVGTSASAPESTTSVMALGSNPSGGGDNADCVYESCEFWNRALTPGEVFSLYHQPDQLYVIPDRQARFDVTAAAGDAVPVCWQQYRSRRVA